MSHFMSLVGKNPHPPSLLHLLSAKEPKRSKHTTRGCKWPCRTKAGEGGKEDKKRGCCQQDLRSCCLYERDCGDSTEKVQSSSQGFLPSAPLSPLSCPLLGPSAWARCWSRDLSLCTFSFCTVVIPESFCSWIVVLWIVTQRCSSLKIYMDSLGINWEFPTFSSITLFSLALVQQAGFILKFSSSRGQNDSSLLTF